MKKVGVCMSSLIILVVVFGGLFAKKAAAMQNEEKYTKDFIEIWDGIDENILIDLESRNIDGESIMEEELMELLKELD